MTKSQGEREAFDAWYRAEIAADPSGPGSLTEWMAWQARATIAQGGGSAQERDAARLDWIARQDLNDLIFGFVVDAPHDGEFIVNAGFGPSYGKTLREAIDKAMSDAAISAREDGKG